MTYCYHIPASVVLFGGIAAGWIFGYFAPRRTR